MPVRVEIIKCQGQVAPRSSIVIDRDGGVIGRAKDSAVVLNDETVSRMHARICFEGGRYYLIDESSNGTFIYNRDLFVQGEKVELADGDILVIGDSEVEVHIEEEESPAASRYPPVAPPGENPVPAPPGAKATGGREGAEAGGRKQTTGPSLPVKEFSIDDFFKDLGEEDVAVAGKEGVSASKEAPQKKRASHSKGRSTEEIFENLDEFFKDVDEVPKPEIESIESSSVAEDEVVAEAPVSSNEPEEKYRPAEPISKISEQIPQVPEEAYRKLLDRFFRGAGLEGAPVENEQIADLMENLGAVFRELVNGLWMFLKGRAEMKAQIRISMTMVQPSSNNPLKFSPTLADAVKHLLKRDHPSFLEPIEAVRDGFEDIMNHQLALNAGIQASLVEALNRFDPERFTEKNTDGLRLLTKGRFWKAYCEAYPELREEALEGIFGKVFIEAYEEQLDRLRIKKTGN